MTKEPCELKSKMKCEDAGRSRPKLKQTNNMKLNSDSSKTSLPSKVDIQCIHREGGSREGGRGDADLEKGEDRYQSSCSYWAVQESMVRTKIC